MSVCSLEVVSCSLELILQRSSIQGVLPGGEALAGAAHVRARL